VPHEQPQQRPLQQLIGSSPHNGPAAAGPPCIPNQPREKP
jgi:hypothetical protein